MADRSDYFEQVPDANLANQNHSPIYALEYNIISAFENPYPGFVDRLQKVVDSGTVLPVISLRADLVSPVGPKVSGEPAEIDLHVTHLEVLWCFIYAWLIRYEEVVQRPKLEPAYVVDPQLLARAEKLRNWAQTVADVYTPWPRGLPSPITSASDQERYFTEKTNLIFQEAISFLLLHEWMHGISNHAHGWRELSAEDKLEREKEADNGAWDILVGDRDDKAKMHLAWAVMSAVLSSFYLLSTDTPVKQFHHPELHHRIQHLLLRFDFSEERLQVYFHGLCVEVLMSIFAIPWEHPSEGYDTYVELLQSILDQLDAALGPDMTTPLKRSRVP